MSISFKSEIFEQFKRVMRARGIIAPDHLEADGEIHRVGTEGREDKYDATYVLRYNGAVPSGGFQNWRARRFATRKMHALCSSDWMMKPSRS